MPVGRVVGIVLAVLWSIVPIYWAVKTSLQTEADARSTDTQYLPLRPTWANYARLLTDDGDVPAQIRRSTLNIVVECGLATLVTVVLATLAAYAFARFRFRGRNVLFYAVLATMAFPPYTTLIPLYRIMSLFGLVNTYTGIVLVYVSGFLPLATWVLHNYFASIPQGIEEAGLIDGAGRLQVLRHLLLPLAVPGIISTALITFLFAWGQFLFPLRAVQRPVDPAADRGHRGAAGPPRGAVHPAERGRGAGDHRPGDAGAGVQPLHRQRAAGREREVSAATGSPASRSVVLVGAGSTVFTPGLMADLVGNRTFEGWTVHLVDLDAEAAEVMARVGRRLAEARGADVSFVPHTDRREALPGARIVTTTIAVGAAEGWRLDLEVPGAYGIAQTVGDSVGPGGVLRALRHVPELVAIARDVADLAPGAQLVNYSNPLTANVRAVTAETGVPAIGLCHGTMHTLAALNADLGLADRADEVHATFAGLNHLCWLLDYRLGTEDLYPRLASLVQQHAERAGGRDAPTSGEEGVHLPVSADLFRTFGRYPAPGDRHVAEFFGWYLRPTSTGDGAGVDEDHLPWGLQQGRDDTIRYIAQKADLWERLRDQADGRVPVDGARRDQEAERLVAIAEALVTGREHVELAVNVPNRGAIANLPEDAVVEVPAVVGAAGVVPLRVGPLPAAIAAVLSARAQQQELTVQAALRGDRALAVQALALDPLVPSPDVARRILDDAVRAHPGTLASFAERTAATPVRTENA